VIAAIQRRVLICRQLLSDRRLSTPNQKLFRLSS
jgi:hypothetical protein